MDSIIGNGWVAGLELSCNQRIALAEMEQRRSKERIVREMHWSWAAQMQQNTLSQYQEGFISESQWDVIAERILVS